jgi:hypothetical protein
MDDAQLASPFLVVLRGEPDDEEIAAATIALLMSARRDAEQSELHSPGWTPGVGYQSPGAWTSS